MHACVVLQPQLEPTAKPRLDASSQASQQRQAAHCVLTSGTTLSLVSTSYTSRSATASHCSGMHAAPAAADAPPLLPSVPAQLASEDSVNCGAPLTSTRVVFCGTGRAGEPNSAAVGKVGGSGGGQLPPQPAAAAAAAAGEGGPARGGAHR